MKFPIYLDSQATTPLDPRVLEEMIPYFTERFGNASSIDHLYGSEASEAVERARKTIARCINAKPEDIIFTSGATESNNIAILGLMERHADKGDHIITCVTEHKSVLDVCKYLERKGKRVTYVPVDKFGVIDLQKLEDAINEKTVLISVMTANNEIGTIAPVEEIGEIARKHGILFHTDAAQAAGHIPIDVEKFKVDLMSISAHKMYGPKGVGALYIRHTNPNAKPLPIIFGGGHEQGIRSGTLNVPGIVGFGKAFEIAVKEMNQENKRFDQWRKYMFEVFVEKCKNVELNGHPYKRLSHNLNVSFEGVENKALIRAVSSKLAISTGSACTTLNVEPSHVILALGFGPERAHTAIRLGFSRFNTEEEIEFATDFIVENVIKLRRIKLR
ncbi:MAG: cysteine desulfurase family protein [Nitrososphaerota archaeon]